MPSINKVILVGNLGKDPEMRFTPAGKAVTSFSLATSDHWTDTNGEKQERTEWHKIVAWGKLAEICSKLLTKGSSAYIEGKLQTRSWEKDGVKHYATEVIASAVQVLGGRGQEETAEQPDGQFDDIPY